MNNIEESKKDNSSDSPKNEDKNHETFIKPERKTLIGKPIFFNYNMNLPNINIYYNKMNIKKKTTLIQREGDWISEKCKNLNFKFRVECNLCKTPKEPKNKEEQIIENKKKRKFR